MLLSRDLPSSGVRMIRVRKGMRNPEEEWANKFTNFPRSYRRQAVAARAAANR